MEYRRSPHGGENLGVIGLGLGSVHLAPVEERVAIFKLALEKGVNFFDLCCGNVETFKLFGEAVKPIREKIYTQMHFGAVYDSGEYGFSRDLDQMIDNFTMLLRESGLGYTDFGYVHCIDEDDDFEKVMAPGGLFEKMREMKKQGLIRHLGFSSHTPSIARRFLELDDIDMFMFSINPAYDYSKGEYGYGAAEERRELYELAARKGVGISVMKPFAAGQLLDEKQSPLNIQLSRNQCLHYVLDRPAVLVALPGVNKLEHVDEALSYFKASGDDKDYSILSKAAPKSAEGRCVYCNHCAPCPMGIDIGLANKYYDLAKVGDELADSHYRKLSIKASSCVGCGHCESRCPFGVKQISRMAEIKEYFGE
ncbi:MAG: aldo/keto reductase [Bacillota bacterium]|nr:aldo/keto reductase [Bacillota bacterium]